MVFDFDDPSLEDFGVRAHCEDHAVAVLT